MWGFLAGALGRRVPEQRHVLNLSFSLSDQCRLEALFKDAGFDDFRVEREQRQDVIESFDEYWRPIEAGTGSIPQTYLSLEAEQRRAVREEVKAELSRFGSGGKLALSVEMLIGSGRAQSGLASAVACKEPRSPAEIGAGDDCARMGVDGSPPDPRALEILLCPVSKGSLEFDPIAGELISRSQPCPQSSSRDAGVFGAAATSTIHLAPAGPRSRPGCRPSKGPCARWLGR
jgi:Trm112p-like protein